MRFIFIVSVALLLLRCGGSPKLVQIEQAICQDSLECEVRFDGPVVVYWQQDFDHAFSICDTCKGREVIIWAHPDSVFLVTTYLLHHWPYRIVLSECDFDSVERGLNMQRQVLEIKKHR